MPPHILLVDDDKRLGDLVKTYLERVGFEVRFFQNPLEALASLKESQQKWQANQTLQPVDLIVSDVMMPEMDGLTFLAEARRITAAPFVFLSARGEVSDKVLGLGLGADDYLPKPFEPRELEARCQALLRRGKLAQLKEQQPEVEINFGSRQFFFMGKESLLTSAEFDILELLVRQKGQVISRDLIMEKVRGIEWESYNRSVDMLISKIRTKIGCDPKHPKFIKTIRSNGYLWIADFHEISGLKRV